MSSTCPCGLPASLEDCCGRFLSRDQLPSTAVELMRSRFTAFVLGDVPYLMDTAAGPAAEVRAEDLGRWAAEREWLDLKVLETQAGGPDDTEGVVVFRARFKDPQVQVHEERSSFIKRGGRWYFTKGEWNHSNTPATSERAQSRNDPCACGSGRKFKKCCGKP